MTATGGLALSSTSTASMTKTKTIRQKRIVQALPLLTVGLVIVSCDLHPTSTSIRRSLLESSAARSLRTLTRTSSDSDPYGRTFGILKRRAMKGARIANGPIKPNGDMRQLSPDRKLFHNPRKLAHYNDTTGECSFSKTLGPTEIPGDVAFENTIIVGYPGGDKRMILRQMEALTELSGRDAWDYGKLSCYWQLALSEFLLWNKKYLTFIYRLLPSL